VAKRRGQAQAEAAERLISRYRAASTSTSVHRGNILEELAWTANETSDSTLKRFIIEAAEASAGADDQSLRIAALQIFRWLTFPDDPYRERVIDWVWSRIDATDRGPEERTYAVSACVMWVRNPRVRDGLLRLALDESEPEDIRALALDCFSVFGPGEAPPSVIDVCWQLRGDSRLGRAAAYVLRRIGVESEAPDAEQGAAADGRRDSGSS
jgi:hypothetical protein